MLSKIINWLLQRPRVVPEQLHGWYSPLLGRKVDVDIYLPPGYYSNKSRRYPLVIFNDGQDLPVMAFETILNTMYLKRRIPPVIAAGIYATGERLREYGTASQADYKGRGDKAGIYQAFVVKELLPFLRYRYHVSDKPEEIALAGFSLGGLSAFDIAWAYPAVFGAVGVFSGALWWRSRPVDPRDPDADRIMHELVRRTGRTDPKQRFWFQCGTLDEQEDRNHNNVIDAIDDTLDLIRELRALDHPEKAIRYLEIPQGEHNPVTWGKAMPDFLRWTFVLTKPGKKREKQNKA